MKCPWCSRTLINLRTGSHEHDEPAKDSDVLKCPACFAEGIKKWWSVKIKDYQALPPSDR